jgi:hypothetical protein
MWVVSMLLLPATLRAQTCGVEWLPGNGSLGLGTVYTSVVWDTDGPGPLAGKLVLGGAFTKADGLIVNRIAVFDAESRRWSALGGGANGAVRALCVDSNGDLIAAGNFTNIDGNASNRVARWTGSVWSPLGSGMGGASRDVYALALLPNGDIVAGGEFTTAGGAPVGGIARWNGTTWGALGSGVAGTTTPAVLALQVMPNGDIVAGGRFSSAGGVAANNIARWDGAQWSALGPGLMYDTPTSSSSVSALAMLTNGDLVAGGKFSMAGGVQVFMIARWNGSSWLELGSGFNSEVFALKSLENGDLVAGGRFIRVQNVSDHYGHIARWDGTRWNSVGVGVNLLSPQVSDGAVRTIAEMPNGDLVAGGDFRSAGDVYTGYGAAMWSGSEWSALGEGLTSYSGGAHIRAMTVLSDGDLLVAGAIETAGGRPVNGLARWSTSGWSDFCNEAMHGAAIDALAVLPDGDVLAGGTIAPSPGVGLRGVHRWDGTAWTQLGPGFHDVMSLAVLSNGSIVAGGSFSTIGFASVQRIAQWNGTAWTPLGSGMNGVVSAIVPLPNGGMIAGGRFTTAGGIAANRVAMWDGTAWSALGAGVNGDVNAMIRLSNGDLIVGGKFTTAGGVTANRVARWRDMQWTAMGTGMNDQVNALAAGINSASDVYAAGEFNMAGGQPASMIARMTDANWYPVASGLSGEAQQVEYPQALCFLPNGDLAVGGGFQAAGGAPSGAFARYRPLNSVPRVFRQTISTSACSATPAYVYVTASGLSNTFEWQIETGPNVWIPFGAGMVPLPCGGTALATAPSGAWTYVSITACGGQSEYRVRCKVSNFCGESMGNPIAISVCACLECPADFNGDGGVDGTDVEAFFSQWEAGHCDADTNADGGVDGADVESFWVFRLSSG